MPTRHDIETPIWRGDSKTIPVQFRSNDAAYVIAGMTLVFTLKLDFTVADEDADFYYSADIGVADAEGLLGNHAISMNSIETGALELATYTYQIKLLYGDTEPRGETTMVWGRIKCGDS